MTIQEKVNSTKHYYKVWFSNGKERTAQLVVDTIRFPFGKTSITTYSKLFPYSESLKMKRLFTSWPKETFEKAFLA